MLDWELRDNGRVLLTLGDNLPFIIYGDRGTGRVIIVNASPDRAWGDFPLTSAFLPLVQQIGRLSITRTGRDASYFVGDACPRRSVCRAISRCRSRRRAGETLPIQPGAPLIERAEHAGIYEVSSASEGLLHEFAVNVEPRESNLAPIFAEALDKLVAHDLVIGTDALRLWLAQSRGLVPLWPLLLVLAVLAFAAEAIYSNILARRRAQGDEGHIATGRLNKRRLGRPHRAAENPAAEVEA